MVFVDSNDNSYKRLLFAFATLFSGARFTLDLFLQLMTLR